MMSALYDSDALELALAGQPGAMPLEEVDGFFCALALAPETPHIAHWAGDVFGATLPEGERLRQLTELLAKHWKAVCAGFRTAWDDVSQQELRETLYLPAVDLGSGDDAALAPIGLPWARGFCRGIERAGIDAMLEAAQPGRDLLMQARALAQADGAGLEPGARRHLVLALIPALQHAFRQMRGLPLHTPARIASKVGRNAPCPCGSGKKYKRCCGA